MMDRLQPGLRAASSLQKTPSPAEVATFDRYIIQCCTKFWETEELVMSFLSMAATLRGRCMMLGSGRGEENQE